MATFRAFSMLLRVLLPWLIRVGSNFSRYWTMGPDTPRSSLAPDVSTKIWYVLISGLMRDTDEG